MKPIEPFLIAHSREDCTQLLLHREKWPEVDMDLVVHTLRGREKLRRKLPSWYGNTALVYPDCLCTEQCSSERTALCKAGIAARLGARRIADITGGLGADSWAFSKVADEVLHNERNAVLSEAAEWNLRSLGCRNIRFSRVEVTPENIARLLAPFAPDLVFIDPARRDGCGKKVFLIEDCQPDVLRLKAGIFKVCRFILLKLSPMADISMAVERCGNVREVAVVSAEGECKELLVLMERGRQEGWRLYVRECGAAVREEAGMAGERTKGGEKGKSGTEVGDGQESPMGKDDKPKSRIKRNDGPGSRGNSETGPEHRAEHTGRDTEVGDGPKSPMGKDDRPESRIKRNDGRGSRGNSETGPDHRAENTGRGTEVGGGPESPIERDDGRESRPESWSGPEEWELDFPGGAGQKAEAIPLASVEEVYRFRGGRLFEPGKGLAKAGLFNTVSAEFNLVKCGRSTHLYLIPEDGGKIAGGAAGASGCPPETSGTEGNEGAEPMQRPTGSGTEESMEARRELLLARFGKCYRIREITALHNRELRALGRRYPVAEVTARNLPMGSETLRRKLKCKAGGTVHLFGLRIDSLTGSRAFLFVTERA